MSRVTLVNVALLHVPLGELTPCFTVHPRAKLQGTYTWPDGRRYDGMWEENRMHGHGVYTDASGHKWEGQFYNGSGPGLTCQL